MNLEVFDINNSKRLLNVNKLNVLDSIFQMIYRISFVFTASRTVKSILYELIKPIVIKFFTI